MKEYPMNEPLPDNWIEQVLFRTRSQLESIELIDLIWYCVQHYHVNPVAIPGDHDVRQRTIEFILNRTKATLETQ